MIDQTGVAKIPYEVPTYTERASALEARCGDPTESSYSGNNQEKPTISWPLMKKAGVTVTPRRMPSSTSS